ncbi:MAG: hypothetical protein HRT73_12920, partial [Flavobacteriales bacterium]|nr:hypothetical protein [Flavobacteriales bacterium]
YTEDGGILLESIDMDGIVATAKTIIPELIPTLQEAVILSNEYRLDKPSYITVRDIILNDIYIDGQDPEVDFAEAEWQPGLPSLKSFLLSKDFSSHDIDALTNMYKASTYQL